MHPCGVKQGGIFVPMLLIILLRALQTSANRGYLVVAPSVFRPNAEEVISITIMQPSLPIFVETKLYSGDGELVAETSQDIFGKGIMKLKIPGNVSGRCNLKICGNCVRPKIGAYTFYNSSVVLVQAKGASAFLTTDKPIYKPGQNVNINVITTGPDLRPFNSKLLVYIEDPGGSRMLQWKDIQPPCCGMLNLSYPISDQPLLGRWRVVVELQGHTYNRTFKIEKYVLPKFEVTVHAPSYVANWKRCETIYVRARYLYGRQVEGDLIVAVSVKGIGYYKDFTSSTAVKHMRITGVASFNACVHHLMTKEVGEHFRGVLHIEAEVHSGDGKSMRTTDTTCLVSKQLVELKFSPETRRHFKPGLPYKGKVTVTYPDESPADNVTVRITADVNTHNFFTRDYTSSAGQIIFNIPALPTMAHSAWLEAKVTQIGEEPVQHSYLPTYMSISSWYSPSKCHILIEGNTDTLRVGEDARFFVHSTCPCNFTMFYEVLSRGNIVQSGIHFARNHRRKRDIAFETHDYQVQFDEHIPEYFEGYSHQKICKIFIKFPVTHEMAPMSRLLTYYVKESGEGVADTLPFKVQPAYRNKLAIALSTQTSLPSKKMKVEVQTNPNSMVCLTAVDRSVLLLEPGARLTTKQVFEELRSYDITMEQASDSQFWAARGRGRGRSRRSSVWWRAVQSKDAQFAFQESGVLVMTDNVQLHFRQEPASLPGSMFHRPGPGFYQTASFAEDFRSGSGNFKPKVTRSYFPETWFWKCFNVTTSSASAYEPVQVTLPDSITSWQVDGVSMSPALGLALAEPVRVRTFQPFFVDFNMPYSVVRGEQVRIPLTIYNYIHACVRVHLVIKTPDAVSFLSEDQSVSKVCVGSEDTKSLYFTFVFNELGKHNINASADAYHDSRCCSGVLVEPHGAQHKTASDSVTSQIICEAEGVPKRYTHSVFFCPNERVQLSTPNRYEFQYIKAPPKTSRLTFSVKSANDVRVSLSPEPHDDPELLEIVLGGWSNSHSWVSKGSEGEMLVEAETTGIVTNQEFRTFTVSWEDHHIQVGYGDQITNETIFLDVTSNSSSNIEYIGFSTGWGAEGEFKITWKQDEIDSTYREVFYLGIPDSYIEGSVKAKATIVGDVMGPTLSNLDKLLHLPYGCGEQNMIHFAPNVYILRYLERTDQLRDEIRNTAYQYLLTGYQRQLTYRRHDGSYSAFGDRDSSGNMWLTAFVLKSFAQARHYMYVDNNELERCKQWILQQQRIDGSFPSTGRLINKDMQGGLHGRVSLTSFVVISLMELGTKTKEDLTRIRAAQHYLENSLEELKDPYTLALSSYALTLLKSGKAFKVLETLDDLATKREGATYWRYHGALVEEETEEGRVETNVHISSAEVETAAYALLTLTSQGDVAAALPIVKWLSQQRNALGGFHSTQDTCIALQALSEYASLAYTATNLTVSLASTNMDLQDIFEVNRNTTNVLQTTEIPSLPAGLFVSADGEGCALLQIDVSYNVPDPSLAPSFSLNVRLRRLPGRFRNKTQQARIFSNALVLVEEFKIKIEACARWLHAGSSNMAVLEVSLLSGFEVDLESLDSLLRDSDLKLKRYELNGRKVLFYFDEIHSECAVCVAFEAFRQHVIGRTKPASVKVYDYYEPGYENTVFYNASNLEILTRSLCDNELMCNQIEEHVSPPESAEDCNSILGCYGKQNDLDIGLCTCHKECPPEGVPVCGSDGQYYEGKCQMEEVACQQDLHLEVLPFAYCEPDLTNPFSGNLEDFSDENATFEPINNHTEAAANISTTENNADDITATMATTYVNTAEFLNMTQLELESTMEYSVTTSSMEEAQYEETTVEYNSTEINFENEDISESNAILNIIGNLSDKTNISKQDGIAGFLEVNQTIQIGDSNQTIEPTDFGEDINFLEGSVTSKITDTETSGTDSKIVDSVPVTIDSTKSEEDHDSSSIKLLSTQPQSSEPPDSADDSMSGG